MKHTSPQEVIVRAKKSQFAAAGEFDYQRLTYPQECFLPCHIEEDGEELVITYQTAGLIPFSGIRDERQDHRTALLADAARLLELGEEFDFTLEPDNLYYDPCFRVYLMKRDVYRRGVRPDPDRQLTEYKALIGYAMQKRYGFEQYRDGGLELMRKNKFLSRICDCGTVNEIGALLTETYEEESAILSETKVLVDKKSFFLKKGCMVVLTLLLAALAGAAGYDRLVIEPRKQAVMASDRAYIDEDYVKLIDSLKPVSVDHLDLHHRYTLALSYVKSENLSAQQRENILSALSVKGDERVLRYWIAIGRLDTAEAENIAMQCSNEELLLYAYLKEKNLVEYDAGMDGEQKAQRLAALTKEIEELSKKYNIEEE